MDEKPLPPNVEPHKLKKPKGWAYPLKTSEIVDGLDLGALGVKVRIFYDNSPERPHAYRKKDKPSTSFQVFTVTYYGHLAKHVKEDGPYFFMSVRVCKPQYRQRLLRAIQEVFPLVKQWMEGIQTKPSVNSISFRYIDRPYIETDENRTLVLAENKGREMFVRKIDLDKEEPDATPTQDEEDT